MPSYPRRLESIAFYVLLATVLLAPIVFVPSSYIAVDTIKTGVIIVGTLLSAILFGVAAFRERTINLPPRAITWTSVVLAASLIVSGLLAAQPMKSFFGQGFELGTVGFVLVLFVSALAAYSAVRGHAERGIILYVATIVSFLILYIFHALRLVFGPDFATFGILASRVSTVLGSWLDLSVYAVVVAIILLTAAFFLPLSRRLKSVYWVLIILSAFAVFVVADPRSWFILAIVAVGLTIFITVRRPRPEGGSFASFFRRLAWLPLIVCVVAVALGLYGNRLSAPVVAAFETRYNPVSLPWQLTLDVGSSVLQQEPLFGIGPNRFSQAYIASKPLWVNQTDAWGLEFYYGFGLIPTFLATQGFVGIIMWTIFFIFLGIAGVRALKRLPEDETGRFLIVSSYSAAVALWLFAIVTVPAAAIALLTFVMTGVFFASAVYYGSAESLSLDSPRSARWIAIVLVVIAAIWGIVQVKKTIALAYFGSGVKHLNESGNLVAADAAFTRALGLDTSDVYLQARAEATMLAAQTLLSGINASIPATTSQAMLEQSGALINQALAFARSAIAYDPGNYYNYVSEGRVSELGARIGMEGAYDNAVRSYNDAIRLNPLNPALYLNLARIHVAANRPDPALTAVGGALQLKNNYLEAIYLLSQIQAAQGNLADAITSAQVATEINPNNAVLFFQLGLLHYNNRNYQAAAESFERAVAIQGDYANARYFLGLSYARMARSGDAIAEFEELAISNPDNQEVAFILSNLRAGRSPFADAEPPVTPTPEKRPTLPIQEEGR